MFLCITFQTLLLCQCNILVKVYICHYFINETNADKHRKDQLTVQWSRLSSRCLCPTQWSPTLPRSPHTDEGQTVPSTGGSGSLAPSAQSHTHKHTWIMGNMLLIWKSTSYISKHESLSDDWSESESKRVLAHLALVLLLSQSELDVRVTQSVGVHGNQVPAFD